MDRKPQRTTGRLGAAPSPAGEAYAEMKANAEAVHATVEGESGAKRSRALTAVTAANIATTSSQAKLPAAENAGQVRRVLCASRLPRRVGFGSSRLHRPSLRTRAGMDAASPTVCGNTGRDAARLEQSPAVLSLLVARCGASSKSSSLRYRPDSHTVLKRRSAAVGSCALACAAAEPASRVSGRRGFSCPRLDPRQIRPRLSSFRALLACHAGSEPLEDSERPSRRAASI